MFCFPFFILIYRSFFVLFCTYVLVTMVLNNFPHSQSSVSFVGNSEVIRITKYMNNIATQTRISAKSSSMLNFTAMDKVTGPNEIESLLYYLATTARDDRIVDVRRQVERGNGESSSSEMGIQRLGGSTGDDWSTRDYVVWYKKDKENDDQYQLTELDRETGGITNDGIITADTTDSILQYIRHEPCLNAYSTLAPNQCRFVASSPAGRLCCTFTFNKVTTHVGYLLNQDVLHASVLLDETLQLRNNFTLTNPLANVRIFVHDPSLNIIASSVNRTLLQEQLKNVYGQIHVSSEPKLQVSPTSSSYNQQWCQANGTDHLIVESWRRLTALIDSHTGTLTSDRCAPNLLTEMLDMPRDGTLNYFHQTGRSSVFKGHLRNVPANANASNSTVTPEGGVELKLTFGQDTKIECMRVFLLPRMHNYMENGNGVVVLLSEIAISSSHQYGMLVLIPVVAATLLLVSFGFTHLTLSLLGHNLNDGEALIKTASVMSIKQNKERHRRTSSSSRQRRSSFTERFQNNLVEFTETSTCWMAFQASCLALKRAFFKLVCRWWLLLVLFSILVSAVNTVIVGRGWSYSLQCARSDDWTMFRGMARFLSSIFRIPVAWMSWREVDNDINGEKRMSNKVFWVALFCVTLVASLCDFFTSFLLINENDHDHVTYNEQNKITYIVLETFVTMCWFALLPFIWKRSHSRRKDVRVVDDDDDDDDDDVDGDNVSAANSDILRSGSVASISRRKIGENDTVDVDEDGTHWTQRVLIEKGWDQWAWAGVFISLAVGIHVGITHLLEGTSDQNIVQQRHQQQELTSPEVSKILEVVWFVPLALCVTVSMLLQPDAHSHTAFALMGGIFAFLVPYILGRSFLFLLVWYGGQITSFFGAIEFGIYLCYMALSTFLLETFRQMSLVALPEENVEDAMAHCFVFQLFSCCFLNFMFIELAPLSATFFAVLFIRGVLAVARGSGAFSSLLYWFQEKAGIMPDILKRPVLTLYMDLRWAHQTLVAEIIAMCSVLTAILAEYMVTSCDTTTGQLDKATGESENVFPVLTSDFSCAQTVSLIVSDFIVLAVMVIALVFSTSIWHHKFHAMKNIMRVTLQTTRTVAMMKTAVKLPDNNNLNNGLESKISKWQNLKMKTKAAQAVGALNFESRKRTNSYTEHQRNNLAHRRESSLALRINNLHKREEHIKKVLRMKSWASMSHIVESVAEGGDARVTEFHSNPMSDKDSSSSERSSHMSVASRGKKSSVGETPAQQARRIAQKATERFNKATGNVRAGARGLWNLREAINLHYKRHLFLLMFSVGYAVCYSMICKLVDLISCVHSTCTMYTHHAHKCLPVFFSLFF